MDKIDASFLENGDEKQFGQEVESLYSQLKGFLQKIDQLTVGEFGESGANEPSSEAKRNARLLLAQFRKDLPDLAGNVESLLDLAKDREEALASTRQMLNKTEDLARVGLHMGGVLHELNNLVGSMLGYAQLAKLTGEEEDVNRCVDVALNSTQRARLLLKQLKSVSRNKNTLDVLNIEETITAVIHVIEPTLNARNIQLSEDFKPVPWLIGSAKAIRQSMLMICSEFCQTIPQGGALHLSCVQVGSEVMVALSEDRNIDRQNRQLALQDVLVENDPITNCDKSPLDREKLDLLGKLVEETKGRLEQECRPGHGFTFRLYLPLTA